MMMMMMMMMNDEDSVQLKESELARFIFIQK